MAGYEFAVLGADQSILMRTRIELDSCKAAWAQVVSLAWKLDDIRAQIRVSNSEGELVIVTGVASARQATSFATPATAAA